MRTVPVSFPVDVKCTDTYCPVNEYGPHSHTLYNVYDVPEAVYVPGMRLVTAVEVATSFSLNESAPATATKGVFQNV